MILYLMDLKRGVGGVGLAFLRGSRGGWDGVSRGFLREFVRVCRGVEVFFLENVQRWRVFALLFVFACKGRGLFLFDKGKREFFLFFRDFFVFREIFP